MVEASVYQTNPLTVSMAAQARLDWVSAGYKMECPRPKGAVCGGPVLVPTRSAKVIMTLQRGGKNV